MHTLSSKLARSSASLLLLGTLVVGAVAGVTGHQAPFRGGAVGAVISATPEPAGLVLHVVAVGQATHLGHYSRTEELVVDGVGNVTGTILFTAANQDTLNATVTGAFTSPTDVVGSYTLVGGTGRFAGATGTATFHAVSPDGIQMSARFDGTIFSP